MLKSEDCRFWQSDAGKKEIKRSYTIFLVPGKVLLARNQLENFSSDWNATANLFQKRIGVQSKSREFSCASNRSVLFSTVSKLRKQIFVPNIIFCWIVTIPEGLIELIAFSSVHSFGGAMQFQLILLAGTAIGFRLRHASFRGSATRASGERLSNT